MKRFYLLLATVAVVGGGALWYSAQRHPDTAPSAPLVRESQAPLRPVPVLLRAFCV